MAYAVHGANATCNFPRTMAVFGLQTSSIPSRVLVRSLNTSCPRPSGHNKWSKIRHKKSANDAARGSTYSAISREIIAAVRNHPTHAATAEMNSKLASVLRKAREMDIPKDKIETTLKKAEAVGAGSGGSSIVFEALGSTADDGTPIAMIVECLTDSPGRTRSKVKEAFNKHNIRLSSTSHLFSRVGAIRLLTQKDTSFDDIFLAAVELGAEDVKEITIESEEAQDDHGLGVEILCGPSELHALASKLGSAPHHCTIIDLEAKMTPTSPPLQIRSQAMERDKTDDIVGYVEDEEVERLEKLLDVLEETADCDRVWSNIQGWPGR